MLGAWVLYGVVMTLPAVVHVGARWLSKKAVAL